VAIWVGRYGTVAIAGYGVAFRLEFFLLVGLSSLGSALVTVLSMNLGAKKYERVERAAGYGLLVGGLAFALVGTLAMLRPELWTNLFGVSRPVAEQAALYLTTVTKAYPILGMGLVCYFIGQGIGKPLWFMVAGSVRVAILLVAGTQLTSNVVDLYTVVTYAALAFGASALLALAVTRRQLTAVRTAAAQT
jgi:Na+-driven multidrug efflux pump